MDEFATLDETPGNPFPVLLWITGDGDFQVASRHGHVSEVPDDVELHRFDVPTTAAPRSAANDTGLPVFDADGCPLWAGARISFTVPTHHVNRVSGTGVFLGAQLGGCRFLSDEALPEYDHRGNRSGSRRDAFAAFGDLVGQGPERHVRLASSVGDRFEHGRAQTFVRLAGDPREVCTPVSRSAPAPR